MVDKQSFDALEFHVHTYFGNHIVQSYLIKAVQDYLFAQSPCLFDLFFRHPHAIVLDLDVQVLVVLVINRDPDLVFLGAPQMFWQFATIPYLAPEVNGMDITEPITEAPPQAWHNGRKETIFVALPDRQTELVLIQLAFPQGVEFTIEGENGITLAYVYKLPKENQN